MNTQNIIEWLKNNHIYGETMEHIIKEVGMEQQMLRQLIMSSNLSDTIEVFKEKVDLEFQNIKSHIISENGLEEEDMDDESTESDINSEAKETLNQLYGISYDDII